MRRDIFRLNESFHLQRPLKVMEVIAHAFVSAERGRFDTASDGLLPFRCALCFVREIGWTHRFCNKKKKELVKTELTRFT